MLASYLALVKKDLRMLVAGKFFVLTLGFLLVYVLYANLGYLALTAAPGYRVYLYDPAGAEQVYSEWVTAVDSRDALNEALAQDANGIGVDVSLGEPQVVLYGLSDASDAYRSQFALEQLGARTSSEPEVIGTNSPDERGRKEITVELLFFELSAVGLLGIASVLFKEKGMGVIRVHGVLPIPGWLFVLSKFTVFILCDLVFCTLLTLANVGPLGGFALLPGALLHTFLLSSIMTLLGLVLSLLLKDFKQFTLAFLVMAIFVATPVFMVGNTPIKLDWIIYHPFYHLFMGLKGAYFGNPVTDWAYYAVTVGAIAVLGAAATYLYHREIQREG